MQDRRGNAQRCKHSTYHCSPCGITSVKHGCIARIGGSIDADRPRSGLADGNNVGELTHGKPMVLVHHLILNERNHSISTAKVEYAYLCEYIEEFEENHGEVSFFELSDF